MKFWAVLIVLVSSVNASFIDSCRVVRFKQDISSGSLISVGDTLKVSAYFASGKEFNKKTKLYDLSSSSNFVSFNIAGSDILVELDRHLVTLGEFNRGDLREFDEIWTHEKNGNRWLILPLKPSTFIDPY